MAGPRLHRNQIRFSSYSWVTLSPKPLLFLALFLGIVSLIAGCKKAPAHLSPSQIHSITQELAAAASSVTPPGTIVRTHRSSSAGSVGKSQSADSLYVGLAGDISDASTRATLTNLVQALDAVATRNHLMQVPPVQSGNILRFSLQRSGIATHTIEIASGAGIPSSSENTGEKKSGAARLAIILDDLGNDRSAADAIFALSCPLTLSVLPNHPHSVEIAEEAHRRGYEVMLHLPMESVGNRELQEPQELRPGMPSPEVAALVDQFLQNVPDVAGVNNHQGSQATSDLALMSELMPVLRDRHLFYIDSRTTASTVAYDVAQHAGVHSAFRNVPFLDDVVEVSAIRKQLELALRGAHDKGEAIAIGHPHPATLEALREMLPKAQAQNIRLVFASDLVH